jgi:hypothetical protein
MLKKCKIYGLVCFVILLGACDTTEYGRCIKGEECLTEAYTGQKSCGIGANTTNKSTCQDAVTKNFLGQVKSRSCGSCNPDAKLQVASLSLQGGQTCPVTTAHSDTFKTPGCWCTVPFVGDKCCFCGGGLCYTTVTWTTTDYVEAPAYGSCP